MGWGPAALHVFTRYQPLVAILTPFTAPSTLTARDHGAQGSRCDDSPTREGWCAAQLPRAQAALRAAWRQPPARCTLRPAPCHHRPPPSSPPTRPPAAPLLPAGKAPPKKKAPKAEGAKAGAKKGGKKRGIKGVER